MNEKKIVSIHSFRGGTGKSNTTANLAAQVALTGKRVAVVDTDIQSPGIHVLFGLNEHKMGKTLNDFLYDRCGIGEVAMSVGEDALDAPGRSKLAGVNLWLIPSSIHGSEISHVLRKGYDVNRLNEGLQTLLEVLDLDYLFIDTHPGLNEETLLSVAISDVLVLLLRPDQQDLQGTAVTVDIARNLGVPNLFLAVNKALSRYNPQVVKTQMEDLFNAPVAGVMPLSEDLVDNGSEDLFSLKMPDHPWSKALKDIAEMVLNAEDVL